MKGNKIILGNRYSERINLKKDYFTIKNSIIDFYSLYAVKCKLNVHLYLKHNKCFNQFFTIIIRIFSKFFVYLIFVVI